MTNDIVKMHDNVMNNCYNDYNIDSHVDNNNEYNNNKDDSYLSTINSNVSFGH